MDPVSLIVAALAAGAVAGAQNTATEAVKDAYTGLKALVTRKFAKQPAGEVVLARHADKPKQYETALEAELGEVDAGSDRSLVAAAERLMALLDPQGAQAGKYTVDLHGSQGVQIGGHNTQTNTFGAAPAPPA